MRVFLDQGVPHDIRKRLKHQHEITTAVYLDWNELKNGNLLNAVEAAGFDVMITLDKDYREYEYRLADRKISLIVLGTGNWPNIRNHLPTIAAKIEAARPGKFVFIDMPLPPKPEYKPPEQKPPFEELKAALEPDQQREQDDDIEI